MAGAGLALLPCSSGVSMQASLMVSPLVVVQVSPSLHLLMVTVGKAAAEATAPKSSAAIRPDAAIVTLCPSRAVVDSWLATL